MSTDLFEEGDIKVTRFAGGSASSAGRRERGRCYQITEAGFFVQLTAAEAERVAEVILDDLADTRPTPPTLSK